MFVGLLIAVVVVVGALELHPGACAGPDRRASDHDPLTGRKTGDDLRTHAKTCRGGQAARGMDARSAALRLAHAGRAALDSFESSTRAMRSGTRSCSWCGSGSAPHPGSSCRRRRQGRGLPRLHPGRLAVAVVHGDLRQFRRGHGRRARQSPGGELCARRGRRPWPQAGRGATRRASEPSLVVAAAQGRPDPGGGRRAHPGRRRGGRARPPWTRAPITGESAPVIRESGGDRSAVTGGTRVLSDWLIVRVTAEPGETFLDRMISMVEGAKRQKTPNEIALNILLAGLTIIFLSW